MFYIIFLGSHFWGLGFDPTGFPLYSKGHLFLIFSNIFSLPCLCPFTIFLPVRIVTKPHMVCQISVDSIHLVTTLYSASVTADLQMVAFVVAEKQVDILKSDVTMGAF